MPAPKFSDDVLKAAVAIRRGQKKLSDVSEKARPAVQDALSRDSTLATYLRRQQPSDGAGTTAVRSHFRFS